MRTWLIYGANGYTGELVVQEALRHGHRPVLAGRSAAALEALGKRYGLETRCFDLSVPAEIRAGLSGMSGVVHCAGPFSATAQPMMQACLDAGVHYLDITGEIAVFEAAKLKGDEAFQKGVVLCPGVGFDVAPSDTLAKALSLALPDASELDLSFASGSGLSPGTAKTMVEALGQLSHVRRQGQIRRVSPARFMRQIDYGRGPHWAMSISWGDISTAYTSTGIPNITVYVPCSRLSGLLTRWIAGSLRGVLALPAVQAWLKGLVDRKVRGGDAQARTLARDTVLWGEVRNAAGERRRARLVIGHPYALTAETAWAMAQLVDARDGAGGYFTPSQLAGPDFLSRIPTVRKPICIQG